jgi:Cu/Ag efflux pump CusA
MLRQALLTSVSWRSPRWAARLLPVTGEALNTAAAVGFIALFGVAAQNGIIMMANLISRCARPVLAR